MKRIVKKGIGYVRKRKDSGKYFIDYWDHLGIRHREVIGTNKNNALNALREKIEKNFSPEIPESTTETIFKDYAEGWIEKKVNLKDATRVSYDGILKNHLIPYFGQANLSEIKRDDIQNFVKKLIEKKLSPKSINNILLVLHQIFIDAEIDEKIIESPYKKIERPRINKQEVDCLQTHEIKVFLKACLDPKENPQNHPFFYTAIFTGMRRGELLGLRWGDIDWVNKRICVRRSLYKGKLQEPKSDFSKRDIDMGPRLLKVLTAYRKKQIENFLKRGRQLSGEDFVFCQTDGRPLDPDNLYHRDFQRILARAKLRSIRIHDLRHTFASILVATGHNLKYVQNQMGHAKIEITLNLYGHLLQETLKDAAKKTEDTVFNRTPLMKPITVTLPSQKKKIGLSAMPNPLN